LTDAFTIVGSVEADPFEARISDAAPLGRSLIGHRAGDTVEWMSPSGPNQAQIVSVI